MEFYEGSFAAKVGWDLSPSGGFPFENLGRVAVVLQPMLRPFNQIEDGFVGSRLRQQRLALLLLDPADGISAIGIDRQITPLLFQQR